MRGTPSVAIITVNWNGKADTLECLASFQQDTYPNKHVFLVDNGSSDDSVGRIREAFPTVTVLEVGRNLGFTGGNNVGIDLALRQSFEYVYLLNNDTTTEPDALGHLVEAAEANADYGLLTPVICYYVPKSEPWFAGSTINLMRGVAVHDNSRMPRPAEGVRELAWASGCALLIRREVLVRLKGFDDRFFLNWEDVDLSLRAARLGWRIGLVPPARIYHKVGRSFSRAWGVGTYYYVRNHLLAVSLHAEHPWLAVARVAAHHLRQALRAIVHREPKAFAAASLIVRAMGDFLRGRFGPMRSCGMDMLATNAQLSGAAIPGSVAQRMAIGVRLGR